MVWQAPPFFLSFFSSFLNSLKEEEEGEVEEEEDVEETQVALDLAVLEITLWLTGVCVCVCVAQTHLNLDSTMQGLGIIGVFLLPSNQLSMKKNT